MQNLVNETPTPKKNYGFIDAIRAIAMMSIVMEHCFSFNDYEYHPADHLSIFTHMAAIQFVKFGTISFFLIAGFLIGEKFTDYTPIQYLKRRIDNTIIPWIFWSLLFFVIIILNDVNNVYKFGNGHFDSDYGQRVLNYLKTIYLYTSFWFIPNFLICIAVLLVFKKYLYSYWFGAVLFLFTILYMFNIYYEWVEPRHSTAIFGFVFFLWLGAQLNRHLSALEKWLDKTSIWLWVVLSVITLVFGVYEISVLKSLHSIDPYNSLRFSNVLYSLSFFFLLLKIRSFKLIAFIKPRETTYGIYLVQYILVYSFLPLIFPMFRFGINDFTYAEVWLYLIARFIIVYALSFLLVIGINKTRAKWLVGGK